jgi:hypothetical protein
MEKLTENLLLCIMELNINLEPAKAKEAIDPTISLPTQARCVYPSVKIARVNYISSWIPTLTFQT